MKEAKIEIKSVEGYKVTKSSPFQFKNLLNRLNFNYFKERLIHFNGTVVTEKEELIEKNGIKYIDYASKG